MQNSTINFSSDKKSSDFNQAKMKSLHPLAFRFRTYFIRNDESLQISAGRSLIEFEMQGSQSMLQIKAYFCNELIKGISAEIYKTAFIRIGRSKECEIAISKDLELSKIHCTILYDSLSKCWKIIDGNLTKRSSNGIWMLIDNQETLIKYNEAEI